MEPLEMIMRKQVKVNVTTINEDPLLNELFISAKQDDAYQLVMAEVGKKKRRELKSLPTSHPARSLASMWDLIGKVERENGECLMTVGSRIMVPVGAQKSIVKTFHRTHLGVDRTMMVLRKN